MISRLILSPYLYPLWRIGVIERAFFKLCRLFDFFITLPKAFLDLFGFDISKWQGVVDFLKMWLYGTKFLILRCVYGITQDERVAEYMANSERYFPRVAVYIYYDPRFDPVQQANKVIAVLAAYKHRIVRVWLDMEFPDSWGGSYTAPSNWKKCRDTIASAGYKVGWYTRATWWDSRVGLYADEFGKDPFWVAQYNSSLTLIPRGAQTVFVWQKGTPAIGRDAGVSSAEIDYNIWNDDYSFVEEWGGEVPSNGGGMSYIEGTVIVGAVKIRQSPGGLEYSPPRYLFNGDKIKASEVVDSRWLKLYEVNGISALGWSSAGSGQDYITWNWVNEPAPEPTPTDPPPPAVPTIEIVYDPSEVTVVLKPQ